VKKDERGARNEYILLFVAERGKLPTQALIVCQSTIQSLQRSTCTLLNNYIILMIR